ncbi:hypothetical protein EDS67_10030 [candidate division KSB1 bacterium]|nr:MAG: hypothetical protein EDS67_10030 [candidate division KSB1 bacterium]MBC6949590.1 hypothetical protein [candidate division KSB1 bacterium]MCE7941806.1 hypothetical protein [Chlorobi bacterium CHB1]MDL1874744.1 hypothetical protein [Cytophagia bacterium CHB2]
MNESTPATMLQLLGAGALGAVIGWYVYYINRYRQGDVQLSDIVTLVGAIGGSAVLAIFPQRSDLFGAYGIGLFAGFFGYFFILIIMVTASKNFNRDWFLDGRRKTLAGDEYIPEGTRETGSAMAAPEKPGGKSPVN